LSRISSKSVITVKCLISLSKEVRKPSEQGVRYFGRRNIESRVQASSTRGDQSELVLGLIPLQFWA